MDIIHTILIVVLLICSAIMTFFILLQEGKGGGLTAMTGTKGGNIEGVTNPVRRATVFISAIWMVCAIVLAMLARGERSEVGDALLENKPTNKVNGAEVIRLDENKNPAGQTPGHSFTLPPNGIQAPGTQPVPVTGQATGSVTTPVSGPTIEIDPKKAPASDVKSLEAPKAGESNDVHPPLIVPDPAKAPKADEKPPETPKADVKPVDAPKAEEKKDAVPPAPATK